MTLPPQNPVVRSLSPCLPPSLSPSLSCSLVNYLLPNHQEKIEVNRKTLTFCAQRLAVSNKRLDQAYYTLTLLKENGEPVPVEAVNAVIVGCAIR